MAYMTGGAVSQQSQADKQADKIQEQAMKQAEQQKLRFNTKKADLMIENMVAQINDHYDRIIEGLKRAKTEKVQEAKGALMEMQADPEAGPQGTLPELPKPEVPFAPDAPEGAPPPQGGMPMEGPPQGGPEGMLMEDMGQPDALPDLPMEGMGQVEEDFQQDAGGIEQMEGLQQGAQGGERVAQLTEDLTWYVGQLEQELSGAPEGQQMLQMAEQKLQELLTRLQTEGVTPEIEQEIQQFLMGLERQKIQITGRSTPIPETAQQGMPPEQGMPEAGGQPQWMPEEVPMSNPYARGPGG